MASNSAPSPATCQSNFEQAVAYALHLWPDLMLAVQNHWGGPDSADKLDWFAGAVVDLFPDLSKPAAATTAAGTTSNDDTDDGSEPDSAYVEEFLLQVMLDEFEVNVDDDSSYEVAEQIMRARAECCKGKFDEVDELRRRWEGKGKKGGGSGKEVVFKKADDQDGETDWDTDGDDDEDEDEDDDDDDDDVEMGDAPPPPPKEKQEPEVDEDGFTKVTKKKR